MSDLSIIFNLDKDFPWISSGLFVNNSNDLITGHSDGSVVYWKSINGEPNPEIICKLSGEVTDIECLNEQELIICSNEGELSLFNLSTKKIEILESSKFDVYNRKWRVLRLSDTSFISSGNYGKFFHWKKNQTTWNSQDLYDTSHTPFGLTKIGENLIASGDYKGRIIIWDYDGEILRRQQSFYIGYNIKQLKFFDDNTLVVIGRYGNFSYLERENKQGSFHVIKDFNIFFGTGEDIAFSDNGKYIITGMDSQLIIYDLEKELINRIEEDNTKRLFPYKNGVYLLTRDSLKFIDLTKDYIEVEKVEFKYQKISLLGESGVGKSSLCNLLTKSKESEIFSTFGKKTWRWNIEPSKDEDFIRKIFLQDLGGQETTLATSLHYTLNSDLILILFKQTMEETYQKAIEIIEEINEIKPGLNLFLIQTFTDHENDDVEFIDFNGVCQKYSISQFGKCTSNNNISIKDIEQKILNYFNWDKAKIVVQSTVLTKVIELLEDLKANKNLTSIDFEDFKNMLSKEIKFTKPHLKYLLEFLNDQGIIEYFPEILDKIILNEEEYEILKSRIPRWAKSKKGIFKYSELLNQFSNDSKINNKYIEIIDQIYQNYEYNIKIGEKRIFPSPLYLQDEPVEIRAGFNFDPKKKVIWKLNNIKFPLMDFLHHLKENNFLCENISKQTGLFYLINNMGYFLYNIKILEDTDIFKGIKKKIHFELYYTSKKKSFEIKIVKIIHEILNLLDQGKAELIERPAFLKQTKFSKSD